MRTMQYALKLRREAVELERWADITYVAPDDHVPAERVAEGRRRTSYLRGMAKARRDAADAILSAHVAGRADE